VNDLGTFLRSIDKDRDRETVSIGVGWSAGELQPSSAAALHIIVRHPVELAAAEALGEYARPFKMVSVCLANSPEEKYDLSFLRFLPNLQQFWLHAFWFADFDQLKFLPPSLCRLDLHATKSSKLSLKILAGLPDLQDLFIEGHKRDIETISKLSRLEAITLRSITAPDLDFLVPLKRLWSVEVKLGGSKNLEALTRLPRLKYLELWRVNGLSDLSILSRLPSLQNVFLQDLSSVTALPDLAGNLGLRRLHIENLKRLTDISTVKTAPKLVEYIHTHARHLDPQDFTGLADSPAIRRVCVGFGRTRQNEEFDAWAKSKGLEEYEPHEFEYQ
jgi:hypothetical protein